MLVYMLNRKTFTVLHRNQPDNNIEVAKSPYAKHVLLATLPYIEVARLLLITVPYIEHCEHCFSSKGCILVM